MLGEPLREVGHSAGPALLHPLDRPSDRIRIEQGHRVQDAQYVPVGRVQPTKLPATEGRQSMRVMIRYKLKRDQVERHLELLRAVYEELESTQPDGLRWARLSTTAATRLWS